MIYKIIDNPTENNARELLSTYDLELPNGFLKGNEEYFSLFINKDIDDVIIGRTFKVNAKTRISKLSNESLKLIGGDKFKC